MRSRTEALLHGQALAGLALHLPQLLRAAAAPRGARGRARPGLPDLRRRRPARGRARGDAQARSLGEAPPAAALPLAHLGAQELGRARARGGRRPDERGDGRATTPYCDAASALDFDDLLLRAVALLEGDARVCAAWRERFPYLLVDEYQDTNRDAVPARAPAGRARGQPDGGRRRGPVDLLLARGGHLEHPRLRSATSPGARVFRLEQNYRSSQRILDAAGALVARNERRKGKTLVAVKGAGERVRLHEAGDEFEEAAWVTEPHRGAARQGARGGAVPDERAEPADRGGPAAAAAPLPGGGRRGLLRAARGAATCSPTCGSSRTRGTASPSGASSTCRRAGSARRRSTRSTAWRASAA